MCRMSRNDMPCANSTLYQCTLKRYFYLQRINNKKEPNWSWWCLSQSVLPNLMFNSELWAVVHIQCNTIILHEESTHWSKLQCRAVPGLASSSASVDGSVQSAYLIAHSSTFASGMHNKLNLASVPCICKRWNIFIGVVFLLIQQQNEC